MPQDKDLEIFHAERAIKHIILRYAQCIDERDNEGFGPLFAPGAVLDAGQHKFTTSESISSVPGMLKVYAKTYHTLLNCIITVSGDKATGVTYSAAHHLTPGGDGRYTDLIMYITYRDRFVRRSGWQFEYRTVVHEFTQTIIVENVN